MNQVLQFIMSNWVEWLFLIITGIIGWGYKALIKKQKAEEAKHNAVCMGVQALLRDRIVNSYNRSLDKGYCPIYERENLERIYSAYHNLGGNDVATGLYHSVMDMPTDLQ